MPKIIEIRECLFQLQLKMSGFLRHSVNATVALHMFRESLAVVRDRSSRLTSLDDRINSLHMLMRSEIGQHPDICRR